MGYEFTCMIPMAVGVALVIVLGLFITLERLEDWAAKLINKNRRITVVADAQHTQPVNKPNDVPRHPQSAR